jgi:pimeloyl-ACP methyl ester carboxylesterase
MSDLRRYGHAPFLVAVIHGGPGVAGEMAPVARFLSSSFGILELFQTASSIQDQVVELKETLETEAECPVVLIGFSWGAWLSCLVAAQFPDLVRKLILSGSGPFEEKFADVVQKTRMRRLSDSERAEVISMMERMDDPTGDKKETFARIGVLLGRADAYDPIETEPDEITFRPDIYRSVWKEAATLRRSGKLLDAAKMIRCPVVAIHGDHDPHPAEGVRIPLSRILLL